MGVHLIRADLLEPGALDTLPDAPNVFYLAGQKFGTSDAPALTWMTNTVLPSRAVARYCDSRVVAFSTGNVYPLVPAAGAGSRESDPLSPIGEYAASCVGRERIFEDAATRFGTPSVLLRLNYAVDLRYGVLVDLARRILDEQVIDLAMGHVNCIWQGDANAQVLRCLAHTTQPISPINCTGPETLSVRWLVEQLAARMGREGRVKGQEAETALLSDTTQAARLFGYPQVPLGVMLDWVADWVVRGGETHGKPTKFEVRDGTF